MQGKGAPPHLAVHIMVMASALPGTRRNNRRLALLGDIADGNLEPSAV
jgi:hypothetical protein